MKIWAKIIKIDTKIYKDFVYESDLPLTHANLESMLREICYHFDISTPIVLRSSYEHFKRFNNLKFFPSDFVDSVDFRYFEIEYMMEKKPERNHNLYSSQSSFD